MQKDVLLKITGIQMDAITEGELDEPIEIVTPASYCKKDGSHYLYYEDMEEGIPGLTENRITLNDERVEIQKSGQITSHMIFVEQSRTNTVYDTPFGQMILGITAGKIHIDEKEDKISVGLSYVLDINNSAFLNCELGMEVVPRRSPQ